MNIRKKFGILFIGILISACAVNLPNNTKNIFDKNYNSYAEQTKLEKQKFLDEMKLMYKNKKTFDGIADISINTNLLSKNSNKSFSVKYKKDETNLRKSNILGSHATNSEHKNDRNIFDIFNPNSLGNLSPYDGDLTSGINSEIKVSGFSLNGEKETLFEQGVLILDFKDKNDVNTFNSLYGGQILEELNGMYRVKVDLNKSPYQNLESLITKYNNAIAVNVNRFEFSSLASLKLFCIVLDFSLNHKNSLNFIALNQASNDLPTTSSSDGVQARPYYPDDWSTRWNVLPSGGIDTVNLKPRLVNGIIDIDKLTGKAKEYWSEEISGWPWRATNVTRAWNYSIGTNVSIAWIENYNTYKVNHPEISRRLKMYGDSNQVLSGYGIETDLIDPDNYGGCGNPFGFNCDVEGSNYHAHYALMTCCAERDNNIPTVGVAPNVSVNPYSMGFLYSTAKSVEKAISHGNNIIGINQSWNFNPFISYFCAANDTASIIGFSGEEVLKKSIKKAIDNNIPVVVAAHNYAKNVITDNWYPANYDNVITVGYVQADADPLVKDSESLAIANYKFAYNPDPKVDHTVNGKGSNYGKPGMIWAPGAGLDVARYEVDLSKIPDKYKKTEQDANRIHFGLGGTSGGAPFTIGVISLMMSRNPALTPAEIQNILVNTSQYGELLDTTNTPVSNQTDLHLINAEEAIKEAIRERTTGSKNPSDFIAKDYYIYTDSTVDNTNFTQSISFLNQKKSGEMLYTFDILGARKDLPTSIFKHVVKLRGWDQGFVKNGIENNSIEMLTAEPINIAKRIDRVRGCSGIDCVDTDTLKDSQMMIISGEGLFAPKGSYGKINFEDVGSSEDVSKKIYTLDLDDKVGASLSSDGTSMSFFLDTNKAKNSEGKSIKDNSPSDYKISFITIDGETNKFTPAMPATPRGFSIKNQPSTITIPTSNGGTEIVPVITSGSRTIVVGEQKIAVPINDKLAANLGNLSMSSIDLSLLKIVQNYAIYGIPKYNPETMNTIKNKIIELVLKDTSGNVILTIPDALQLAALAINLNPKYPDGSSILSRAPFISDNVANEANNVIKVKQGDVVALSINGMTTTSPLSVTVSEANYGNQFDIYKRDGNVVYFTVSLTAPLGLNSIVFYDNDSTSSDGLIFHNAIEILPADSTTSPSQTNRFPSSITVNGVTTTLDYGFNFDFSEASGNTVFDSSGKNNNGEFATLHGLLPLRTNSEGINFQAGSYITVPYSPSYNLPRKFAFLTTLKLHEKNREQLILYKWEDGYINGQFVHSYNLYISDDNKITLTIADNKINYYSITYNADIPFDLEKEVGIAVIVNLDTKTVKMVKNQTVVDGNVLYDGIWYHYSSLNQFGSIKNSNIPLNIGNYTSILQGDWSMSDNLNADLTNVSSVISEVTPEQVSKIFYDMGLRD